MNLSVRLVKLIVGLINFWTFDKLESMLSEEL